MIGDKTTFLFYYVYVKYKYLFMRNIILYVYVKRICVYYVIIMSFNWQHYIKCLILWNTNNIFHQIKFHSWVVIGNEKKKYITYMF